jgi:hypothetical protein
MTTPNVQKYTLQLGIQFSYKMCIVSEEKRYRQFLAFYKVQGKNIGKPY